MSDFTDLLSGVPQGSIFGRFLFFAMHSPLICTIYLFNNISSLFYADDIQLYCPFKRFEFQIT